MDKRAIWVLVGAACVGGSIFYANSRKAAPVAEAGASPSKSAQVDPELARMKARLAALEMAQNRRAPEISNTEPAPADDAPTPAKEHDEPEPESVQVAKQRAGLDKLLEENRDPTWASSVESRATATLQDAQFEGSHLVSVRCAARVCRIVAEHVDADHQEGFHERLAMSPFGNQEAGAWSTRFEENGRLRTAYYIARSGHVEVLNPAAR